MKPIIISPDALQHLDEWKVIDAKMLAKIISLLKFHPLLLLALENQSR